MFRRNDLQGDRARTLKLSMNPITITMMGLHVRVIHTRDEASLTHEGERVSMVIQPNMVVSDIVKVWPETKVVFARYGISPSSKKKIEQMISKDNLDKLLADLNQTVGSSELTCIEGG